MEPEGHGRGMVRRVLGPLAEKDIKKKKVNLTELCQNTKKKKKIDLIFNILML